MTNDRFRFRIWRPTNTHIIDWKPQFIYQDILEAEYCVIRQDNDDYEFCTGLKDKNGNLIYENDIIKIGRGIMNWVIMVDDYGLRCICPKGNPILGCVEWSSVVKDYLFDEDNISVEIIGNIHENPELLKEVK